MTEPQTKPQTLEALLRRWAELEPGRCIIYPNDRAINVSRLGKWPHVGFTGSDLDEDRIQAATQEAIERRGWHWSVWTNPSKTNEPPYGAAVWVDLGDEETNRYGADTPAAALLSAYVQALEAKG